MAVTSPTPATPTTSVTGRSRSEMSYIPGVARPSPRKARKIRQSMRECQPELHDEFKKLRCEQRADKTKQIQTHVDWERMTWAAKMKIEGRYLDLNGEVNLAKFPGALTPSRRTSRKWSKRLWKIKGNTRTSSHKSRFYR